MLLEKRMDFSWSLCKVKTWRGHGLKINSKHHSQNGIFRVWQSFFFCWYRLKFVEFHFLFRKGHRKVGEASCHFSGEVYMKRNSAVWKHLPKSYCFRLDPIIIAVEAWPSWVKGKGDCTLRRGWGILYMCRHKDTSLHKIEQW